MATPGEMTSSPSAARARATSSRTRATPRPATTRLVITVSSSASTDGSGGSSLCAANSCDTSRVCVERVGVRIQGSVAISRHSALRTRRPGSGGCDPVDQLAQWHGLQRQCRGITEEKAGIEAAVSHAFERGARHGLMQLEAQQRVLLDRSGQHCAEPIVGWIGDRSTCSSPATSACICRAARFTPSAALRTFCACISSCRPASVSSIPVAARSNSLTSSVRSSALMWPLTAGWLKCSRSAARVRCPSSATVGKRS